MKYLIIGSFAVFFVLLISLGVDLTGLVFLDVKGEFFFNLLIGVLLMAFVTIVELWYVLRD